jgi:predicted oxidoreductase (fatty acid repression mutant protein)
MPKHVKARVAQDEQEERQVRKLAKSHHAPADWKFHAQMVIESWAGKAPTAAFLNGASIPTS